VLHAYQRAWRNVRRESIGQAGPAKLYFFTGGAIMSILFLACANTGSVSKKLETFEVHDHTVLKEITQQSNLISTIWYAAAIPYHFEFLQHFHTVFYLFLSHSYLTVVA